LSLDTCHFGLPTIVLSVHNDGQQSFQQPISAHQWLKICHGSAIIRAICGKKFVFIRG
jgi:hypothetical protein